MAKLAEKGFEPLIDAKEASVITGLHYSATKGDGRTHRPKEGKEMQKTLYSLSVEGVSDFLKPSSLAFK